MLVEYFQAKRLKKAVRLFLALFFSGQQFKLLTVFAFLAATRSRTIFFDPAHVIV